MPRQYEAFFTPMKIGGITVTESSYASWVAQIPSALTGALGNLMSVINQAYEVAYRL